MDLWVGRALWKLSSHTILNSSYYSWACISAVFVWKRGVWVIVLKRKCLCIKYSNILAILSYFWLILPMMRHCTAYGCSNRSNKVGWENLSWHKHRSKHRFCCMARAGTTEHLNMLFFGKYAFGGMFPRTICFEFTTFAVDHDPNASLSCPFTWKPLNCRLNCNKCYSTSLYKFPSTSHQLVLAVVYVCVYIYNLIF